MKKQTAILIVVLSVPFFCACKSEKISEEVTVSTTMPCSETVSEVIVLSQIDAKYFIEEVHRDFCDLLDKVNENFDYWNNNDFSTIEDIREYERLWQEVADDARDIQTRLSENAPPTSYKNEWETLTKYMGEVADILELATDMDPNSDGEYTGTEMAEHIRAIKDAFVEKGYLIVDLSEQLIKNLSIPESHEETNTNTYTVDDSSEPSNRETVTFAEKSDNSSSDYITSKEDYNNLTYREVTDDDTLGEVWAMTQSFVKDKLKSPTSAKFPTYGDSNVSIKNSGNYFKIIGYVDAENSFGADIRSTFLIVLEKSGSKYTLKECTIY